jgi:uncharacterized protein YndB with AHSA1/START domain
MKENLVAFASIFINASPQKTWEALTSPEMIKQYFFGTETTSDWKEGKSYYL